MKPRCIAGVLAAVLVGAAVAADPAPEGGWALPKADAEKWVGRVRQLTPEGWTVSARGNDVLVQRDKPVPFARAEVNAPPLPPGAVPPPADLREGVYRLTLRFAPRMSYDEYEKLAAMNAASDRERERLQRALGLPHKFDDFIATTPEEKDRLQSYREAVKKLTWHTLPDLYTPDYSIFLFFSHDGWSYVSDKKAAAECAEVEGVLLKYFGMYSPRAAAGGQGVGRPEPPAGR
jgi:hypothetical protein